MLANILSFVFKGLIPDQLINIFNQIEPVELINSVSDHNTFSSYFVCSMSGNNKYLMDTVFKYGNEWLNETKAGLA